MKIQIKALLIAVMTLLSFQSFAGGQYVYGHQNRNYSVTITNITKGISFTPFLVATHRRHVELFSLGKMASDHISRVAEGGDISGLNMQLSESSHVHSTAASEALLAPGESVTIMIDGHRSFNKLSLISMLLPTNDTVVALLGKKLPKHGSVTYLANAYDAGSESNDEYCSSIPGPHCGGSPFSPEDDGEGYVYPSPGIHGQGDLNSSDYQWDGAVAKVVIKRMH